MTNESMTASQIAAEVRRWISVGKEGYRRGDRAPSVRGLAEEFGVSQQTAAAAYASLEAIGLVRVGRGMQGTTVVAGPAASAHLGHFSPPDLSAAQAWTPEGDGVADKKIVSVRQMPATDEMVAWGLPAGGEVVERVLVRTVDGVPVQHKVTLLPMDVALRKPEGYDGVPPMLVPVGADPVTPPAGVSMAKWLGWGVVHSPWEITVEPMTAQAAQALGMEEGVPAYRLLAIARNADGGTVFVTVTTIPLHHRITMNIIHD